MEKLAMVGRYVIAVNEDGLYLVLDKNGNQIGCALVMLSSAVYRAQKLMEGEA